MRLHINTVIQHPTLIWSCYLYLPGVKLHFAAYDEEIHWDYEKKAEPEVMAGKNGVNKFISDSYGYGGYRESEMARDQWKDLTYDNQHGAGASKNRRSYYDNWDQDFEQKYVRELIS